MAAMEEESGGLRAEVLRLAAELQEATRAQEQAARCGLALLEENGELRQRCRDLEGQLEALRAELACATEVLGLPVREDALGMVQGGLGPPRGC
uniref:Uncharacterized protein n=1 Tax=Apteryx owenii TaxID=8824 RepID=A0A8B9P4S2_APTOW